MNALQLKLAKKNSESVPSSYDDLYAATVVSRIRERKQKGGLGVDANQELALLRKEVARLTEIVQTLHPDYQPSEEFANHNALVEQCKTQTKQEMGIGGDAE